MKTFFDLLIAILIIITALPAVILLYSRTKRKHSWEKKNKKTSLTIAVILLLVTLTIVYGSFVEPNIIITNKYEVDLPNIEMPITIAFMSDLQVGKYKQTDWIKYVVERTLELEPDIVLIGGDQVDNEIFSPEEFNYLKPLENLAEQIPTYTVHGNHEYGLSCYHGIEEECQYAGDVSNETKHAMEKLGIKYLVNNLEKITVDSSSFYLFGGDSYWAKKLDYSILETRKEDIPTITLIHNPSFQFSNYPTDIDLALSGHTHGGQIRLPVVGPIGLIDNLLQKKYYHKKQKINN
mgnify:FL=1